MGGLDKEPYFKPDVDFAEQRIKTQLGHVNVGVAMFWELQDNSSRPAVFMRTASTAYLGQGHCVNVMLAISNALDFVRDWNEKYRPPTEEEWEEDGYPRDDEEDLEEDEYAPEDFWEDEDE